MHTCECLMCTDVTMYWFAFLVLLLCDPRLLLYHITSLFSWGDDVLAVKVVSCDICFPYFVAHTDLKWLLLKKPILKKCHSGVVIFHFMHLRRGLIAYVSCQGDTANMLGQATDSPDRVLEYLVSSGGVELSNLCQVPLTQSFTSANPGGIHLDEKRLKSGLWNTGEEHMALESYKFIHLSAELMWWTAQAAGSLEDYWLINTIYEDPDHRKGNPWAQGVATWLGLMVYMDYLQVWGFYIFSNTHINQ